MQCAVEAGSGVPVDSGVVCDAVGSILSGGFGTRSTVRNSLVLSFGPFLRPLAFSSPCAYYTVGLSAALALKDTLSTFECRRALVALTLVLSCV